MSFPTVSGERNPKAQFQCLIFGGSAFGKQCCGTIRSGEEQRREEWRQRGIAVKVIRLEDRPKRRREDDLFPFFGEAPLGATGRIGRLPVLIDGSP